MPYSPTSHVILTSALVFAGLLFIIATSYYAGYVVDLRIEMELRHTAYYIANVAQQLYLVVNSSDFPTGPTALTKALSIPADIEGNLYSIEAEIQNAPQSPSIKSLTVTTSIINKPYLIGKATVIIGDNVEWLNASRSISISKRAMVLQIAVLKNQTDVTEPWMLQFSFQT